MPLHWLLIELKANLHSMIDKVLHGAASNNIIFELLMVSLFSVLAVGRQDGLVCLHSVEDGHLLHEFSAGAAITQLQWTQQDEDR